MIADGLSTKQVARALGITQKTVHNHLNAIYRRLDTQSLTHAVLSAVRLGIIDLHSEPTQRVTRRMRISPCARDRDLLLHPRPHRWERIVP